MQIEWKVDFELGIEKIDNQHMRLVALINRLEEAKQTKKDKDTIDTIFIGLMDYCQYHFTVEEITMKSKNYFDLETHRLKHRTFVSKMKDFKNDHLNGNPEALASTIQFLNLWLVDHIMVEDRKYVPFLK